MRTWKSVGRLYQVRQTELMRFGGVVSLPKVNCQYLFDAIRPSFLCHRQGQITLKKNLTRLLPLHLPADNYCYFILLLVPINTFVEVVWRNFCRPTFIIYLWIIFFIDRYVGILLQLMSFEYVCLPACTQTSLVSCVGGALATEVWLVPEFLSPCFYQLLTSIPKW